MALDFAFTANNKNFMNALNEITSGVDEATHRIKKDGVDIEEFFNRVRNISAISFAGFGLGEMVSKITSTRAYFQDIESSMKVFLGSAEKAAEFTKELQDYAYYNMYEFKDLADGSKQLIAYGNDAKDVTSILHKLSEVGVATGQQLGDMVGLYNKAKATGVVDGNAIESWASKGLIIKDVMKEMGTYVEGQTVTFKQLNEVLDKVTSEGGRFHGIQDSMMDTINSNIGQLQDQLGLLFNEIGGYLEEPINYALKKTSEMMDNWKEIGFIIASVLAAAGTQKGMDLVTQTFERTATQSAYASEIVELQSLLPLKEAEEQTSLQQAVASGHLTEAKAAEIVKLREEVEEYAKMLEDKETEARGLAEAAQSFAEEMKSTGEELIAMNGEEIESLQDKINANNEWLESLDENIQWMFEEQVATENASLAQEINTLQTENNSIQKEINSAAEASNTASRNLATVSAEREAVATGLDTAASTGNTFAKKLQTVATTVLTQAQARLNEVIAANPYAIAIAAVAALSYAIYKLVTYETDLEKVMNSAEDAVESQTSSMHDEISTLNTLKEKLDNAKKGTKEWKEAKDEIVEQFGQYFSNLDEEISKTGSLTSSYNALTKAIRLSAAARAMEKFQQDNDIKDEVDKVQSDTRKKLNYVFQVDKYGKQVLENGKPVRVKVDGKLGDSIMQKSWEYQQGRDVKFTTKEKAYLEQTGFFDQTFKDGGSLEGYGDKMRRKALKIKQGAQHVVKSYGFSEKDIQSAVQPDKQNKETRNAEQVLSDDIKGAKDAWHLADKTTKEGQDTRAKKAAEIKKLEKEYEERFGKTWDQAHKKSSKKSSGSTSAQTAAKEEAAESKVAELMEKQALERLRLAQDYEYERWQTRIDLMEEGEAKLLAQEELNFSKEKTELGRRKEQELEAERQRQIALFNAREDAIATGNKKYAKKTFNDSDIDQAEMDKIEARYKALEDDLTAIQKKSVQDRLDAAKESMNNFLKEFGNYAQKRKALEDEWEKKISESKNSGERRMNIAQRNRALADLDFKKWQEDGDIALAFGDITKLSKETVSQLISDMEKYRSKIIATFDPVRFRNSRMHSTA